MITASPQMGAYLREVEATPHGIDHFEVAVRTDQPFGEFVAALQSVMDLWCTDLAEDDDAYFELGGPAPSPWGHLVAVSNSYDFDRSLSWLLDLLMRAQVDGMVEPFRPPTDLWSDHDAYGNSPDQIVGTVDLRADVSPGVGLSKIVRVPPERTAAVVAWMTRWCFSSPADVISRRIRSGAGTYDIPDRFAVAEVEALLQQSTEAIDSYAGIGLHVVGGSSFRSAVLSPYRGSLALTHGWSPEAKHGWPRAVADVSDALIALAPHAAHGRVGRSRSPIDRQSGDTGAWPGRNASYDSRSATDAGQITDAYGVLLLGPGQSLHLPTLDPTRWAVQTVGDSTLLTHRDPDLWFRDLHPQDQELARSRSELAALLVPQG